MLIKNYNSKSRILKQHWFLNGIVCSICEYYTVLNMRMDSYMCPWSTKTVISCILIFVAIDNNNIWVIIIVFYYMPKIIRILRSCSMKIFSTFSIVNISKRNFWLLICIAENFIWTTLKMIFSIFRFFCTFFKYYPIITNHTSMDILYIQLSDDA